MVPAGREVMSRVQTARAIVALQAAPRTVVQLAAEAKFGKTSAEVLIHDLMHAGFVEFSGWGEAGKRGGPPATYAWKKPPAMGWTNGPGPNGSVGGCDVEVVGFEVAAP